jgi:hypothetical protein
MMFFVSFFPHEEIKVAFPASKRKLSNKNKFCFLLRIFFTFGLRQSSPLKPLLPTHPHQNLALYFTDSNTEFIKHIFLM